MTEQLVVLQVVIPLLSAPICLLLRRTNFVWLFTLLVSTACFAVSIALLIKVLANGAISYSLGGWQAPIGVV